MLNKDLVNIKIAQNINHATNIFNQQKKNGSYGSSPRAYSTIISALQVLFDSNIANRTIKYYIVDGNDKKGGDLGIDAICFNNYDKTIYILDVKEGGSDGFGVSTVRNLLQDVTSRFLNKKNDLEGINSRLRRAFSQGKNLFF